MPVKLLAAYIAAFAVCAAATASSLAAEFSIDNAPYACNQIFGGGPLSELSAVTCLDPAPEYSGLCVPAPAAGEEPDQELFDQPAFLPAAGSRLEKSDAWAMAVCGVVCLALGNLRFSLGRRRHRPGVVRKSRLELRMMA